MSVAVPQLYEEMNLGLVVEGLAFMWGMSHLKRGEKPRALGQARGWMDMVEILDGIFFQ